MLAIILWIHSLVFTFLFLSMLNHSVIPNWSFSVRIGRGLTRTWAVFNVCVYKYRKHHTPVMSSFLPSCLRSFLSTPPTRHHVPSSPISCTTVLYSWFSLLTIAFVLWSHREHCIKEYWTIAAKRHTRPGSCNSLIRTFSTTEMLFVLHSCIFPNP